MTHTLSIIRHTLFALIIASSLFSQSTVATTDMREMVELPSMMKEHMLSNMRDHLEVIHQLLIYLSNDELDKASDLAESRLGMSSLESHGASHLAKKMPVGMQAAGTNMHRAASQFARVADEGDKLAAFKKLSDITAACVACHAGYRVQ